MVLFWRWYTCVARLIITTFNKTFNNVLLLNYMHFFILCLNLEAVTALFVSFVLSSELNKIVIMVVI